MPMPLRNWRRSARSASMMASDLNSASLPTTPAAARVAPVFGRLGPASRLVLALATILALSATASMILEGFSRYVLDVSYFWADESVRFLVVWAFFLTLGIAGFRHCLIRAGVSVTPL